MSARHAIHDEVTSRKDDLKALARLCEYVAQEAFRLDMPEAEVLGIALEDRFRARLEALERH